MLSYDSSNRLAEVSQTAGSRPEEVEKYEYDYEGNRISKITNNGKISYVIDNSESLSRIAAEINTSEDDIVIYHSGLELDYMESRGRTGYYIYDGHGDVRALSDGSGGITDTYRYDAFGGMLHKEGDSENHFLYTAQYYDELPGLYYLRARYMNPEGGCFITSDTYEGSPEDPVSLHKYLYANADPVQNYDPDGHMALLMAAAIDAELSMQQAANDMMLLSIGMAMLHAFRNMVDEINAPAITYSVMGMVIGEVDRLTDCAADVAAEIREYVETEIAAGRVARRKDGAIYTVYTFADKEKIKKIDKENIKNIKYVGRTKDYDTRLKQHRRIGVIKEHPELKPGPKYENLTYEVCRGIEQALMVLCHTRAWLDEGGYNKINGIAQSNKKGKLYYFDTIGYIENQLDNDMLCKMEKFYGSWWK